MVCSTTIPSNLTTNEQQTNTPPRPPKKQTNKQTKDKETKQKHLGNTATTKTWIRSIYVYFLNISFTACLNDFCLIYVCLPLDCSDWLLFREAIWLWGYKRGKKKWTFNRLHLHFISPTPHQRKVSQLFCLLFCCSTYSFNVVYDLSVCASVK